MSPRGAVAKDKLLATRIASRSIHSEQQGEVLGAPGLFNRLARERTLADERPQHAAKRENFARIDSFVDDTGDQFL